MEEKTYEEAVEHFATTSDCCLVKYIEGTKICSQCKAKELDDEEVTFIHKRMNDINTFQAHENEVYLRGTDEYGKDFQICFDSYDFLEWIDKEQIEYIQEQLIKYIKSK